MRVNGSWEFCEDNAIRPLVQGLVQVTDTQWMEVTFLLDAGADRTVFSARLLHLLRPLEIFETEPTLLAGVGGQVNHIIIETALGLRRDDEQVVKVRGTFGVFKEDETADLSVLGRDVTNNFGVIYDYPNQTVALLAPPHFYEIKS